MKCFLFKKYINKRFIFIFMEVMKIDYTEGCKLRVVTLFSGYDSQCLALDRLRRVYPEFAYELVGWCEIDRGAIVAHNALYQEAVDLNLGDISLVDAKDVPDCDLMTWSFPCTDISGAGRQAGLSKDSGTRSSLAWEALRIFRVKRPKYLLMENVSDLVGSKFIKDFHALLRELDDIGYDSFTHVLDARDYGVPQHRERVFVVSILRDACDGVPYYNFPEPFGCEKVLEDLLEDEVDRSYYLSKDRVLNFSDGSELSDSDSDFGMLFDDVEEID